MFNVTCNIDKDTRTARIILGVILLLGALLGLSTGFLILIGLILVVEGAIGWCAIPFVMSKFKKSS